MCNESGKFIIENVVMKQSIPLNKITVLIGPNNSGKSQFLRDIFNFVNHRERVIIDDVKFREITFEEMTSNLLREKQEDPRYWKYSGLDCKLKQKEVQVHGEHDAAFRASKNLEDAKERFNEFRIAYLDADSRLQMAKANESSDSTSPVNLLHAWDLNDNIDSELRSLFQRAFGMDMILDPGSKRTLRIVVGQDLDTIPKEYRQAFKTTKDMPILDNQGDGFKSFVGIALAITLCQNRAILIDEPESFLHPTQNRLLGNWISTYSKNANNQIIIATHSVNFLEGILSGMKENDSNLDKSTGDNLDIDIIRLNRKGNTTKFTKLSMNVLEGLYTSPLLSAQPVMDSLFHQGVVVCEGDSDRIFYQTVMTRYVGNDNLVFIHAHNKETTHEIVKILKNSSVPVSVITDFDIVNNKKTFLDLLQTLTDESLQEILDIREEIKDIVAITPESTLKFNMQNEITEILRDFDKLEISTIKHKLKSVQKKASFWEEVKTKGLEYFHGSKKDRVKKMLDECKKYGLFIVPNGELESWIRLDVKKNRWISQALIIISKECPENLKIFLKENSDFLKKSSENFDG